MTDEKKYFIELLSSFVNRSVPTGRRVDFNELFRLADIHDVAGIIDNQLKQLDGEFLPQGNVKSYFNQSLGYTVKNYALRENAYQLTKDFIISNGCRFVFVKGINVKRYYPQPELRTSGDIDVIVDGGMLEKLYNSAKEKGYVIKDYVSHTLTLKLFKTDIEIHSQPDVFSDYFDDIFAVADKTDDFEYSLNEYNELLFVLCHLAKHLAYRGAGIRMLLDIDLIIRGIGNFDSDYFFEMCSKANILKTAETLTSLCKLWFDTPIKSTVDISGELLANLENVFLDGGSFGYEMNSVPTRYLSDGNNSKFKVMLKMAFPSREYLKICYPYYNKHAFLYPVARINRPIDGLFKKKNRAKEIINNGSSFSDSGVRFEVLKELGIEKV